MRSASMPLFLLSALLYVVGLDPALVDAAFTLPVRCTSKRCNLKRVVNSSSSNSNNEDTTTSRVIYRRIVTSEDDITIVAEDIQTSKRITSAQIISLGYAIIPASSSTFEDDVNYNTKYYNSLQQREVVKSATDMIESDINEQIWEEFDDDSTPIPTGLSSLPWTNEYRAASRSAVKRRERREMMIKQEEEYAKRNRPRIWELSFIPFNERVMNNIIDNNIDDHQNNWQQYKNMIQIELLQQILQEQSKRQYNKNDELYAITPLSIVPLLVQERFGFVEVRQVPKLIAIKMSLKNTASKLLLGGEENICLIRSKEIL